jgi:hypothetical protein
MHLHQKAILFQFLYHEKANQHMSVENMVKQDNPMSSNQFTVMFLSTNSWYTKQKMHARTTYNADT